MANGWKDIYLESIIKNYRTTDKTMGNEYEWTPKYMSAEIDENTLCQFTGLTDKNGNKIWENDVVIYDNSSYSVYCTPHTGKIAWRNGCLCFKHWLYGSISYKSFLSNDFFGSKCEVIGNTIENPELLDNKTECER